MRLVAQAKMGYYPTPDCVVERMCRLLCRSGPGVIRLLDPCAGEGRALQILGEHLGAETYGVELDRARAQAAKATLTRVLHADLRETRIANGAFGLLYLNPPYDFDVRTDEGLNAERLERVFLQATLRSLQPQGILVSLIPEHRLDAWIARLLAYRCEAIRVFRFPEREYQRFRQIVLVGVKKQEPFQDEESAQVLRAIGRREVSLPELLEAWDAPYPVPVAPPMKDLLFQRTQVEPEDLLEEIERHGLYPTLLERLTPARPTDRLRPLMPLRKGHLALVLATGHLNNEVVEDPETGERFLVKGTTRKEGFR